MIAFAHIVFQFLASLLGSVALLIRPQHLLEAENLFLRRQLALHKERGIKPRRIDAATRTSLAFLSKLFDWRTTTRAERQSNSLASKTRLSRVPGSIRRGLAPRSW